MKKILIHENIMKKESDSRIKSHLREIYEPRYGRPLSDAEVYEIRTNLRAFAEAMLDMAERIYGKSGKMYENADEARTAQRAE